MVGRREQRRRNLNDVLFDSGNALPVSAAKPYVIAPPRAGAFPAGSELARVHDDDDDILVKPGHIVALGDTRAFDALADDSEYRHDPDAGSDRVAVFKLVDARPDDPRSVERILTRIGELLTLPSPGGRHDVAPAYGFRTHQTNHPSEDPEPSPPLPPPDRRRWRRAGTGVNVVVVDTGWWAHPRWSVFRKGALGGLDPADQDLLYPPPTPARDPGRLGFAAGHGTHVAGIVHQVAPRAWIDVRKAVSPDGIVDELLLLSALRRVARGDPRAADIVVLPLGGQAIHLGSFSTAAVVEPGAAVGVQDRRDWLEPLLLLDGLELVVRAHPTTVVVASAGNDDSREPCFPAAFTVFASSQELRDRMISVAALEADGSRYCYSNYGEWVVASTRGARVRSCFVEGVEDPRNDPDPPPDDFTDRPYAEWSGTSFAAPAVAGQIAAEMSPGRRWPRRKTVTALDAWSSLSQAARSRRPMLGAQIDVSDVSYG